MEIKRYHNGLRAEWDDFNAKSVNGTFFFTRKFLDYHADRFSDYSLIFYQNNNIMALLPLHLENKVAASHRGLSFGGFILSHKVNAASIIQMLEILIGYLKKLQVHTFLYKPQPYVYLETPAQDDLYALFHFKGLLRSRQLLSVLDITQPPNYSTLRKRCLKKAKEQNLIISACTKVSDFMGLVNSVYQEAQLQPTHTANEMQVLMDTFPENIFLWVAHAGTELVGGVLLFVHRQVVNLQYIATSPTGKKMHALDLLIDFVVKEYKGSKKYLSFGSSHDVRESYGLNLSLLQNKFSYGARGVIQDTYSFSL